MRRVSPTSAFLAGLLLLSVAAPSHTGAEDRPSRRHFLFLDPEFILTLELVRPGVPIFNFVNLGNGSFSLQASDIRIISGIKLYRPNLFEVETSVRQDPMRVSAIKIHPHSSFGLTLKGNLGDIREIDRVTVELGLDRFELLSISSQDFETMSGKISKLNLISPDIREDFRVLELKSRGSRKRIPK